jgi:hypothetical protein
MATIFDPTTGTLVEGTAPSQADSNGIPKSVISSGKVPMLKPDGSAVFVKSASVEDAIKEGYVYESPEMEAKRKEAEEYDNPLVAGTLGAARGVSLGLSDVAASGLGFEDDVRKYKEHNPVSSNVGEFGSTIATAIASGGGSLGAKGITTAAKFTPVGIATRLGAGASENIAKKIVTDGASKMALRKAGAMATGAAIEGGFIGAGQAVSDVALQEEPIDPRLAAEQIAASAGVGALLGGGLGFGASLTSQALSATSNKIQKVLKGETKAQKAYREGLETQQGFFTGERALEKPKAPEIRNAAYELSKDIGEDVVPTQGMLSESPIIQGLESSLEQSPTIAGRVVKNETDLIKSKLTRAGANVLEEATTQTPFQIGEAVKEGIERKILDAKTPLSEAYQKIEKSTGFIDIPLPAKEKVRDSILNLKSLRVNSNSPVRSRVEGFLNDLVENVKSVDDLKTLSTSVKGASRATFDPTEKAVYSEVTGKLNALRDRWIKRSAISQASTSSEGRQLARDLLGELYEANKGWQKLSTLVEEVGEKGKVGRVRSIDDLLDRLDRVPSEKLAEKLYNPNSVDLLKFMKQEFPEQAELMRKLKLQDVINASTDPRTGEMSIPKLVKATDKFSPEVKQEIFGTMGSRTLKNIKTLYQSSPKMMGPSGTAQAIDFQNIFGLQGILLNVRDAGRLALLRGGDVVENAIKQQNKTIEASFKKFLDPSAKATKITAVLSGLKVSEKDLMPRIERLADLSQNPQTLVDQIAENTKGLGDIDEDTQTSLNNTLIEAVNFLQTKAPKNPGITEVFGKSGWRPSDAEIAKFNRYVRAVDDPLSILDDFNARVLTPEAVESVRTVYPELYRNITQKAIERVSTHKGTVPYQDRIQLSILLSMPVSSSMEPDFMQTIQSLMENPYTDESQVEPRPAGMEQIDRATSSQTSFQKALNR